MSIKYRLVKRKNMSRDAGADEKLVYAQARTSGELTFEMLCKQIAAQSTASFGDVELVIRGMVSVATEALLRGESVSLGALGRLRVSLGSQGVATEEEFTTALIRKPKYVFTPGSELKKATSDMSMERMVEIVKECDKPHLE